MRELEKSGADFEPVNYYKKPFTKTGLMALIKKLGMKPRELLRKKEEIYKKLKIGNKKYSDNEIIDLMLKHPDLIQRPIVVHGEKVILARPPERIKEIL